MFSKNYDKEIKNLMEENIKLIDLLQRITDSIKDSNNRFIQLQDQVINLAKVQATHKAIIEFLIKNAKIGDFAEADYEQMREQIEKIEKIANKVKKQ